VDRALDRDLLVALLDLLEQVALRVLAGFSLLTFLLLPLLVFRGVCKLVVRFSSAQAELRLVVLTRRRGEGHRGSFHRCGHFEVFVRRVHLPIDRGLTDAVQVLRV
jgi:hypothetical protein